MHLLIDRAAFARPAAPVVWQSAAESPWRRRLAPIWREAMDAWALMARYRFMPGVFW